MGIRTIHVSPCSQGPSPCSMLVPAYARNRDWSEVNREPDPKNPDPKNFLIKLVVEFNGYFVALVEYPNCTNFEGKKIIVFRGLKNADELLKATEIDPHFTENSKVVARFRPTEDGWEDALRFVKMPT